MGIPNREMPMNETVKQLIIGALISDGEIRKYKYSASLHFQSSDEDYVLFKQRLLEENGIPTKTYTYRKKANGTINHYIRTPVTYKNLLEFCQRYEREGLPFLLSQVNDLGIALWIFDDGSLNEKNRIYLYSFKRDKNKQEILANFLNEKGFECCVVKEGSAHKIQFNVNSSAQLAELIRPYCVPSMERKINIAPRERECGWCGNKFTFTNAQSLYCCDECKWIEKKKDVRVLL